MSGVWHFKSLIMIRADIDVKTYFFTVDHITKEKDNKLIYGINLNNASYFLSKTTGVKDAIQLDDKLPLGDEVIKELNDVITSVELKYNKLPSLRKLNTDIFSMLMRLRQFSIDSFKKVTR
jgi:hypothetical protein